MNILVVEDDADLRVEIVEYLERRHHVVTGCATLTAAGQALNDMIANGRPPDAAVCDVGLPDGDGVRFYLANASRVPACRWTLMSGGHDLDRLGRELRNLTVRPVVLEKPVPMRSLWEALEGMPGQS
jgi:DNA-binding NtrC family response regulator